MLKSFGLTDRGKVRKDNQDCFILEICEARNCLIAALCDGMGGAKAGGIASQLATKAFVSYVFTKLSSRRLRNVDIKRILEDACTEANGVSYEYSHFDDAFDGMGTTIVGGVIKNNGNGYIINVGDSRAYLISRRSGNIRQITNSEATIACDFYTFNLQGGDILLLCSDGLSNIVSDLEMLEYAKEFPQPEELCRSLMSKALNRGARDNVTVVAVTR